MSKQYFGTDGVRGKVGVLPITPEFVMRLGYAAGKVLSGLAKQHLARPTVLIGKDTRISGYMLEAALQAGFTAAGMDVVLAGPVPTPAVAYLTRALRLTAGVVISASHNPFDDNGIKFFSDQGNKLPDEVEQQIEIQLDQAFDCVSSEYLGKVRRLDDASGRYIEFCKSTFPSKLHLRGLKIVVDCAHGAAYHIAPHVFHELGAEVIPIGNQPNGKNINDHVGATHTEALSQAVKTHGADIGIALDGDADRLMMVDETGRVYNGDELLYVLAQDLHEQGNLPGVVGTVMTNMALEIAFKKWGVPFVRAKVGDRYVLEALHEKGWQLGGESSGHILCLEKHSTGDGIISALQVLSVLRRHGQTLSDFFEACHLLPQALLNVCIKGSEAWEKNRTLLAEKEKIIAELGESGRVLIRASGTEPLLRIMVEAPEKEVAHSLAKRLASAFE